MKTEMPRRQAHQGKCYFVTLTIVDWIDVFTRKIYFDLIIEHLQFAQEHKGLDIYAYVIMTNHLHLIARSRNESMNKMFGHFKAYSAKKLIELIKNNPKESRKGWMIPIFKKHGVKNPANTHYQFWQQGNYPILLYSEKVIIQKLNYIHNNPVKAGLAFTPEEYYYSSAHQNSPLKLAML